MDSTGASGLGANSTSSTPPMYPTLETMCRAFIPTASMIKALMKIATVNPQKAGPQINPICSLVKWNAALNDDSTSPRMAKTMDVVSSDRQLVTNSLCLFMFPSLHSGKRSFSVVTLTFLDVGQSLEGADTRRRPVTTVPDPHTSA